jgi:signal transduction histidine kinase
MTTAAALRQPPRVLAERFVRRLPLVCLLALGVPVTVFAVVRSTSWIGVSFPGFLLMENAVVPTVSGYGWPAERTALFHSQVLRADGVEVRSSADVYRLAAERPPGTEVEYELRKGSAVFTRALPTLRFGLGDYLQIYGIILTIGVMSCAVGLVVGFLRPGTRQSSVYQMVSLVGCLFASTAVFLHSPGYPLLTRLYLLAEAIFPAVLIHLACVFPVDRPLRGAWLAGVVGAYGLGAALVLVKTDGFDREHPDLSGFHVNYVFLALSFVVFLASTIVAYVRNRDPSVRARIKVLLPGVVLGGVLSFIAFADNAVAGGTFPMQLGLVFVPLFYASVAYAIVKHDLFDVDRFVRRSFVYGLLSVIVIAAYALLIALPARLWPSFAGQTQSVLGMVFVLALGFVLDPLRRAVQDVVDRAFYRTRLDYRATIDELSQALTSLLDLNEVVAQVTRVLTDEMHLESTCIFLAPAADVPGVLWRRRSGEATIALQAPAELDASSGVLGATRSRFFAPATLCERLPVAAERERAAAAFAQLSTVAVVPLVLRERAIGMLLLGRKRSGRPFTADDRLLLRTLGNQTAIALENARSYQALAELTRDLDGKVRRRTEELRSSNEELTRAYDDLKHAQAQLVQSEKMASLGQLVAGVAHELNNPASFVHGGLANLQEYLSSFIDLIERYEAAPIADPAVERALRQRQEAIRLDYLVRETPELLRICAEGSERIKKIVDDLRVFARADRGEREPVAVADGIDGTLRLLADRLGRADVVVRRQYDQVPRLEANASQLNQVWMNLLGNAIDALEGRKAPEIQIRMRVVAAGGDGIDGGAVRVEIRDNGPGISPSDLNRIFEPFFTTKPVGRGTGLGLSIAYGAVKSHGGTIAVTSEPGAGTSVVVTLPTGRAASRAAEDGAT